MILQKQQFETDRPKTNAFGHKTFYTMSVIPGRTNYIFKKTRVSQDIQAHGTSNFRTNKQERHSLPEARKRSPNNHIDLKIEPTNEISCTSFMKSYIEKLKKERKRQNKKIKDSKNNKQQVERINFTNKHDHGKNQMYLAKQMNHIFILQKIPRSSGNGLMNTISVVEEDLLEFKKGEKFKKQYGSEQKKWDQPSWANKDKIDKLIKQIRNSRKKIDDVQQTGDILQLQDNFKSNESYNLPILPLKSREVRSRAKSKQVHRNPEVNFRILEPWKQDQNLQQFTIEEYNEKI